MYFQYPRHTHTSRATRLNHRHNPVGVVYVFNLYPGERLGGATPGFMAESRWDSRRGMGQGTTFGFPEGKRRSPTTSGVSMHIMGHRPHHFPAPNAKGVVS